MPTIDCVNLAVGTAQRIGEKNRITCGKHKGKGMNQCQETTKKGERASGIKENPKTLVQVLLPPKPHTTNRNPVGGLQAYKKEESKQKGTKKPGGKKPSKSPESPRGPEGVTVKIKAFGKGIQKKARRPPPTETTLQNSASD